MFGMRTITAVNPFHYEGSADIKLQGIKVQMLQE